MAVVIGVHNVYCVLLAVSHKSTTFCTFVDAIVFKCGMDRSVAFWDC